MRGAVIGRAALRLCSRVVTTSGEHTTQEYNAKKRAEHTFKSFTADSTKISAVDPDFYAERFLNWMETHVA